ncbi:hypothetical protein BGX38DRAFT_615123 [Terfezia claveryi]|nr:hypothetical protein BGX38DRAFT_615123 [Terfezia claveryi]
MMDLVSLTIGVVGLAGQLAKAATDCYMIFDDMSDVGTMYDSILHRLRTEGLRLKGWEEAWGLGDDNNQGRLDPKDYRYRYATATLARIVAAFASVDKLQAKYGIAVKEANGKSSLILKVEEPNPRRHSRLSIPMLFRSRSKSRSKSTLRNANTDQVIPTIHETDVDLLENPRVLANQQLLPGLPEEISSMTDAMGRLQQSLSMHRKLRWVVADKAKLDDLLRTLTSLNDGLFHVLPTSAKLQVSTLKLLFDIPFLPNVRKSAEFVGREYLIESLKQNVEEGKHTQNTIVLYGTGGMGKTQLALEYIHQHYRDYSSVFWINAASDQTTILGYTQIMQRLIKHHAEFSEDYSHIGRLLGMAGKLDFNGCFAVTQPSEAQYVVDAVKQWFALPENTNWLLVFDNLDDPDLVDIEEYIPACNHGTVIITSRRRDLQQGRRGFEVQQMQPMEAIQLLLRACAMPKFEDLIPSEQTTSNTIAEELGYLPLALDQAGAYIHMAQYSLVRYLTEYQTNMKYILSKGWKGGKQDRSVFATWEISFNAIQKTNPEAAKLLLICGFLNNEDICEELLKRGKTHDLAESIRVLFSYSIAKRSNKDDSFSIHPLVHSWAKLRLESEPQKEIDIAREAFEVVVSGVDESNEGRTEDWIFERRVMPHIDAVTKHMAQYAGVSNMSMNDGCMSLGDVYRRHGRQHEALGWYRRALAGYEKVFGVGHLETLTTVHNMASVYDDQGQYGKALEWYGRALAGQEKALGADHPNTLTTVNNMAAVFQTQGQYEKALKWYGRAFAGSETALGVDHPDTLTTVHNMALVFDKQGQYEKALEWYGRALTGQEKALGVDHQDTFTTVHNMALVFDKQGQYEKALKWYGRSLAGREKVLGVDHLDTLTTIHDMAGVFDNQGQYEKALEWYGRVLAGSEKAMGVDHPGTLSTVNNMALVFSNQGQYEKALKWYGRALAGYEEALGVDHPSTLTTVHSMASVFQTQGQYDKALEWYGRAFAGQKIALGVNHPDTLTTINNMAGVFDNQGLYEKALEWYGCALAGSEKALGVDHQDTLSTVNYMALVFDNQGQYVKALEWYGRALAGREKVLGMEHPDTLTTVHNMAGVFDNQGQYEKALEWYGRTLAGFEKALGVDHPWTKATIQSLIDLHERTGQTVQAQILQTRLHLANSPSS